MSRFTNDDQCHCLFLILVEETYSVSLLFGQLEKLSSNRDPFGRELLAQLAELFM